MDEGPFAQQKIKLHALLTPGASAGSCGEEWLPALVSDSCDQKHQTHQRGQEKHSISEVLNQKCALLEDFPGGSNAHFSLRRAETKQVLNPDLNNSRKFILMSMLMKGKDGEM